MMLLVSLLSRDWFRGANDVLNWVRDRDSL